VQELIPAGVASSAADGDEDLFEPHEWENREERGLL
jgi:hypothetical protein